MYPDQDRRSVGPDLGPNCLQRLSAGEKVTACKDSKDIKEKIFQMINKKINYI